MSNLFRLGIIGTGQIAKMAHVPAALASTKVEITALVDPVVKHAQELADGYGMTSKIATTPAEVLAHVDGVVIATPNHTHRDLAVQCARAKIHCLIEKPLATTVAEAKEIVQAAEEHSADQRVLFSCILGDFQRRSRTCRGCTRGKMEAGRVTISLDQCGITVRDDQRCRLDSDQKALGGQKSVSKIWRRRVSSCRSHLGLAVNGGS